MQLKCRDHFHEDNGGSLKGDKEKCTEVREKQVISMSQVSEWLTLWARKRIQSEWSLCTFLFFPVWLMISTMFAYFVFHGCDSLV